MNRSALKRKIDKDPEELENDVIVKKELLEQQISELFGQSDEPLNEKLAACTFGSKLDILQAGSVVLSALVDKQEDVQQGIEEFANQYAGVVTSFDYPQISNPLDNNVNAMFVHGLGVQMSLLTKFQEKQCEVLKKANSSGSKTDMGVVKGSCQFVRNKIVVDGDEIFKNYEINVSNMTPSKREEPHLVLIHYLRLILMEITHNPYDIQNFTRVTRKLSGCPSGSKIKDTIPFPDNVYNKLFDYFMQYFNFCHPELELPWSEDNDEIGWIRSLGSKTARPVLFSKLAQARQSFMSHIFDAQFKAALTQLRAGTIIKCEDGSHEWIMRKH